MSSSGVAWIACHLKKSVKDYFDAQIEDGFLERRRVHDSYQYPAEVDRGHYWTHVGIFYDYLIRKEINNLLQKIATDRRAEEGVDRLLRLVTMESGSRKPGRNVAYTPHDKEENVQKYYFWYDRNLSAVVSEEELHQRRSFVNSYRVYKNPANSTLDILGDIFHTAMLHVMYFGGLPVSFSPSFINERNVEDTLEYVRSLDLLGVELNPLADCEYFFGDADVLLHDSLLEIKVSKYHYNLYDIKSDDKFRTVVYQMILYTFGFYKREGKEIKKFRIYNPLLGFEYILFMPKLNYTRIEDRFKKELSW